ncbi:MAG: hypothetical protein AAF841_04125 [Pseudomonadota bacterium]
MEHEPEGKEEKLSGTETSKETWVTPELHSFDTAQTTRSGAVPRGVEDTFGASYRPS